MRDRRCGIPVIDRVLRAADQSWVHEPGSEFLAANPIHIPRWDTILKERSWETNEKTPDQAITWSTTSQANPFVRLPKELLHHILSYLTCRDAVHLRLVSPVFHRLPGWLFRDYLKNEMPWLWEVDDLQVAEDSWQNLYRMAARSTEDIKGLKKRKMVWEACEEICKTIKELQEGNQ